MVAARDSKPGNGVTWTTRPLLNALKDRIVAAGGPAGIRVGTDWHRVPTDEAP